MRSPYYSWMFQNWRTEHSLETQEILRVLHQIQHNLPARRNDHADVTGSSRFPLQFCGTRWIEDKQVAPRAIEIWDEICQPNRGHSGSHCLKSSDRPVKVI